MEKSKSLLKIFRGLFSFRDFVYILQLEEYYSFNYFSVLRIFFFRRFLERHDKLNWTLRAKATFLVSLLLFLFSILGTGFMLENWLPALRFGLAFILGCFMIPIWVGLANVILYYLDKLLKLYIRNKAENFVKINSKAKIVAIAGSFGKTTTKNFIFRLIRYNYKVQTVEGNVNTPTGIAYWILKNLDKTADIILVEMDTYEAGEIAKSCKILPPDIAVITSVGDQHLSRFGEVANLARALWEIRSCSRREGVTVMEESVKNLADSFGLTNEIGDRRLIAVPDNMLIYKNTVVNISDSLISRECLALALKVADLLDIPADFVQSSLKNLISPDRRLHFMEEDGYKTIDDSYNISLTTAKYGVLAAKEMATKLGLKLLVITGGIPESGEGANLEYGRFLKENAGELIILDTCYRKDLIASFDGHKILNAGGLREAWLVVKKKFSPDEVLVLKQPELTDLSY